MKTTRLFLCMTIGILVALIVISAAWAEKPIHESRSASPDGVVEIESLAGSITIIGWDRAEVEVTGVLGDEKQELEIEGEGDRITIEVVLPRGRHQNIEGARLEIKVPRASRVEVESISANIEASEVSGRLNLETVSGNVTVEGEPEELELSSVSGDIRFECSGMLKRGSFETVSGNVVGSTDFDSRGSFSFESVSGNVELRVPAGVNARFEASTFSGSITNEIGPDPERSNSILPSQELEFTLGSGSARISLQAFSGNVKILSQ